MESSDPRSRATVSAFLSSLFSPTPLQSKTLARGTWVGMTVLLFLLFGLSDLLIATSSRWPFLYGVDGAPIQKWEEVVIYVPFAQAFSLSHPFPVAPVFDPTLVAGSVFPWVPFLLCGVLLKAVAFGNLNLYLLLTHTVAPVATFWLIYLVYRRYVSRTWGILLAFFGVTYFSGFHYGGSLSALLGMGGEAAASPFHYGLPEITRTPFPSLSLLLFMIPFYLTVRSSRLDAGRLFFLGFLWGLQIYVYFFNFVAGVIFFALWIIYARRVSDRGWHAGRILGSLGIFVFICAVFAAPYYAAVSSPVGQQLSAKLFAPARAAVVTSDWGLLLSYGLPLLLLLVPFFLFRGDRYELFYRCMPVFLVFVVDLLIGSMEWASGGRINPELYFHRISNIAFRFFYFIPFLYFISLPEKALRPDAGRLAVFLHQRLPNLLRQCVHRYRLAYSVAGIALLSLFITSNNIHVFRMHERHVAPAMSEVERQLRAAHAVPGAPGSIVAYESLAANLVAPAVTNQAGLLVSAFGNFVDETLILERILLYAKLFGWSEERLLAFMEPHEPFARLSSYRNKQVIVTAEAMQRGLGYWLLNHRKIMTSDELAQYRAALRRAYGGASIEALLARHPVSVIVVRGAPRGPLGKFRRRAVGEYTLVFPDEEKL